MPQHLAGTFAAGRPGAVSGALVIPSGVTFANLNLSGVLDASNSVQTQKSVNGLDWSVEATYTDAQVNTAVPVAHGEHWRLAVVAQEALNSIDYSLSVES